MWFMLTVLFQQGFTPPVWQLETCRVSQSCHCNYQVLAGEWKCLLLHFCAAACVSNTSVLSSAVHSSGAIYCHGTAEFMGASYSLVLQEKGWGSTEAGLSLLSNSYYLQCLKPDNLSALPLLSVFNFTQTWSWELDCVWQMDRCQPFWQTNHSDIKMVFFSKIFGTILLNIPFGCLLSLTTVQVSTKDLKNVLS